MTMGWRRSITRTLERYIVDWIQTTHAACKSLLDAGALDVKKEVLLSNMQANDVLKQRQEPPSMVELVDTFVDKLQSDLSELQKLPPASEWILDALKDEKQQLIKVL